MELAEALRRRRMVRAYDPGRGVPTAALQACLVAGTRAPSAGFSQGVSLLVWEAAADRDRFWAAAGAGSSAWARGMRTAPVLVGVWTSEAAYADRYALPDKGVTGRAPRFAAPYWYVDAGMAAMAVLLAAVDQGLGACFFGVPPDRVEAVRAAFGVPGDQLSVGVVSLGYAAPGGVPGSPARRARRPLAEVVHRGAWSARGPV